MMKKSLKTNNKTLQGFRTLGRMGFITAICLFLLVTACEDYNQDDYKEVVVLEAYAGANRPLPEVRVSSTLATGTEYSFSEAGLAGANVQIVLLDESGGGEEEVFEYIPSSGIKGLYLPENQTHRMLPRRTYRIDVDFDNRSDVLRAETTIPDSFEILGEIPDTVVYQSSERLELLISDFERTQNQSIIIFNTVVLDPHPDNLTPFYKNLLEEDDDENIEDYYNNESPPINEANFGLNPDETIAVFYPWIAVAFFGDNLVITNSIDKNLADLISSQAIQLGEGGGTLSPGEIPNLRYHVEGGIGIFGSFASDTVQTFFTRQEGM